MFRRKFYACLFVLLALGIEAVSAATDPSAQTLVLIGASYVGGWKTPALPGYVVVNKGVSGEETSQVLARFQRDAVDLKPSSVLIWGHINNIHRGDRNAMRQVREKAIEDYQSMVKQARAAGIRVILATEVTLSEAVGWRNRAAAFVGRLMGKRGYNAWVNDHVRAINQWLRDYAKREQLQLLDFEEVFDDGEGFRKLEYSSDDGTHISAAGYAALTSHAQRFVTCH